MKIIKNILKWICYVLLLPITYLLVSLLLTFITIDRKNEDLTADKAIYLTTNGVHLEMVIPLRHCDNLLLKDLNIKTSDKYVSFGWGDENFYINTPNWSDLTVKNAFIALFLKSPTLLRVTRYKSKHSGWIKIKVADQELNKLNSYIIASFKTDDNKKKVLLKNQGYSAIDDFYKAKGNYSIFYTCNSWVNNGFKKSGLKACLWTPFDFGLIRKYTKFN